MRFLFYLIFFPHLFKNQILGKSIRVDHVQDYKAPKDDDRYDDITRRLHQEGCAPKIDAPVKHEEPRRSSTNRNKSPRNRSRSRSYDKRKKEESKDRDDKVLTKFDSILSYLNRKT